MFICYSRYARNVNEMVNGPNPSTPTVLWNAMIYPFLNMTIKGAIWYQGESNAGEIKHHVSTVCLNV